MTPLADDILRTCEALPPEKQIEVADFARFLLANLHDEQWEQTIAADKKRPRLEAFVRESAAENAAPLDLSRL